MQLRLTRRALADLGLDPRQYSRRDARDYVSAHPVVRAFVERRSQGPRGQETTHLPVTAATVYNLHVGRSRGLTWHDEEADVVWLLGAGLHESGSAADAYAVLKERDRAGSLMPDEADYLDLEMTASETADFVRQVALQAPQLVDEARRNPATEVRGLIAGRLEVGVQVERADDPVTGDFLEEVWIGFRMPPQPGPTELPSQPEWALAVLAAMVPVPVSFSDLDFGGTFPRPGGTAPNEIVVCWRSQ